MSIISFNYNIENAQTADISTTPFPQPTSTNGLGLIFTGYVKESSSYVPLFDNFGINIGYATFNDTTSNLGYNQKVYVTEYATYFINGTGSITYSYSWENNTNSDNFSDNSTVITRIIASTGNYYNKTGPIVINIDNLGNRNITISFNN
jgi:hypothetical protein